MRTREETKRSLLVRAVRSEQGQASNRVAVMIRLLGRLSVAVAVVLPMSACTILEWGEETGGKAAANETVMAAITSTGPSQQIAKARMSAPSPIEGTNSEADQGTKTPEIHLGTGVFIKSPPLPVLFVEATPVGDIILNFAEADIREVIQTILGDVLEVNYVIDPEVQGTVTAQTSRPLSLSDLLPTLEAILNLNGAALIRADELYKIVPREKAPQQTILPEASISRLIRTQGFGIQVVPLSFVSAAEMAKILKPLVPEGSILRVDETRNLLILAAARPDLGTMLETVEIFDVDWMSGMSFGLFPLQFLDPQTMVEALRDIMGQEATGLSAGLIRLIPIERITAVLVISPQAVYVERVRSWIGRLDQSKAEIGQRLFVYYVQNRRATELADVLNEAFSGKKREKEEPKTELAPGLEPVELELREVTEEGETPAGPESNPTNQARGSQTAGPERVSTPIGTAVEISGIGSVRIIADEANNALVILATPAGHRMVLTALEKLDVLPFQVLIEATIADVTLKDELKYGLQWFLKTEGRTFTFSEATSGEVLSSFPGFSYLFLSGGGDVRTVLNALSSVTDVNIISSPTLMVLNNQTATLQVGDSVPIATQTAVSITDPDAPLVSTIQFRDTGVLLRVTPRVNADGLVIMEIEQEASDVTTTTTSGIDSPTIRQRKITSTVAIQSGETIALGGLIRDTKNETETGIPVLKDIPIFGSLFKATSLVTERTELLVLITPRVVRTRQEARTVTNELRQRLRAVVPLERLIE